MDFNFGDAAGFGESQNPLRDGAQFPFRPELHFGGNGAPVGNSPGFLRRAHSFENAVPIFTLRKRAGAAPWPVPMVCIGCPLPQFGVPQRTQWSALQMASQEFQNSVVMPL